MVYRLFKHAQEKALTGTYIELYQIVEQTAAKDIHPGGADEVHNKVRKLAEAQDHI